MLISSARFVQSNTEIGKLPPDTIPEYAFIGRSNVGKSSLINMLCQAKDLAKTSGKPGKTRLINHFLINENTKPWYIVDLPGYGFAKASKTEKNKWEKFIAEYFLRRKNLLCIFVLIDSRLEPQKIDLEFMEWLGNKEMAFAMVFTKIDKQSVVKTKSLIAAYNKTLLETWEEVPMQFVSSAVEQIGRDDLLEFIDETNGIIHK